MKTIQEIDFWGDPRPKLNHSPEEISFPVTNLGSSVSLSIFNYSSSKRDRCSITTFQESAHVDDDDDYLQETTHHKKIRKIATTIRLFGTNITTTTTGTDDLEDGGDDWEKRRKAAKGKEIVLVDHDLIYEPDYYSQIFNPTFEDGYDNPGALVIHEPRDKKNEKKKAQPRKSKKKSTERRQVEASAPLPQLMQQEIKNRGGSDPFFLFAKDLTCSDIGSNLNRLFINQSDKLMEALTEEEQKMVNNEEYYSGLRVLTMDAHAEDRHHGYDMKLTRWNVGAYMIVLKKEWMKFVRANNLQEGDRVEGWGFRKQGDFYLALNVIRKVA